MNWQEKLKRDIFPIGELEQIDINEPAILVKNLDLVLKEAEKKARKTRNQKGKEHNELYYVYFYGRLEAFGELRKILKEAKKT